MKALDFSVLHHIHSMELNIFMKWKLTEYLVCIWYICAKLCAKTDAKDELDEVLFLIEVQVLVVETVMQINHLNW